jgi:hypothetical protein
MDHSDAEQIKAAERYMLGDLTVSEVEEYERHFFDCPQCSEELRVLVVFQENARAVFREQDLAPKPIATTVPESAASWWSGWFSPPLSRQWAVALGALLIGIFAGYAVFQGRDGAQGISAYPLYAQARGEETMVTPAAGSKFYSMYFDQTWGAEFTSYSAELRDASGAVKLTVPVNGGAAGEAIHVLVPTHQLSAGRYVLVLASGDKAKELARFPFTLQFK